MLRNFLLVTQILLSVGLVGLQIVIAFVPGIAMVGRQIPQNPSSREMLDQQTYVIGLQFAILTAGLMGFLALEAFKAVANSKQQAKEVADYLAGHFPRVVVKPLAARSFYSDFLQCVGKAAHTVKITYLDNEPPSTTDHPYKLDYYATMMHKMKTRDEITFKRLVRKSRQNSPWVAQLIRELEGNRNNCIALIEDPSADSLPMALSVQVVDTDKVWFVAIASHHQDGEYRDMHIEDKIVGQMMNVYYDRLWARATKLLDNGKVTADGKEIARNNPAPTP